MNKILVATYVCWLRSRNFSVLWYRKHESLARDPPHGRYQICTAFHLILPTAPGKWVTLGTNFATGGATTDSVPAGRSGRASGALSSKAAERMVGSGRDQAHSMRQSAGTTMVCVTWRHVSRGTFHVPPREPLRKQALGQNF